MYLKFSGIFTTSMSKICRYVNLTDIFWQLSASMMDNIREATRRMPPPHIPWPSRIITCATWQTTCRTSRCRRHCRLLRLIIAISATTAIHGPSPASPSPLPVLVVYRRRARRHGTVQSCTALNQSSPEAIIVPRTIMYSARSEECRDLWGPAKRI